MSAGGRHHRVARSRHSARDFPPYLDIRQTADAPRLTLAPRLEHVLGRGNGRAVSMEVLRACTCS
jgi:hypothetical protein